MLCVMVWIVHWVGFRGKSAKTALFVHDTERMIVCNWIYTEKTTHIHLLHVFFHHTWMNGSSVTLAFKHVCKVHRMYMWDSFNFLKYSMTETCIIAGTILQQPVDHSMKHLLKHLKKKLALVNHDMLKS